MLTIYPNRTRRDAVIPLSEPIRGVNGHLIHEIPVPDNTNVIIGIMAANRNPELWGQDAHKWIPERWLSPLPDALSDAPIPGVYSNLCV